MGGDFDLVSPQNDLSDRSGWAADATDPAIAPGKVSRTQHLAPRSRRARLRLEPGRLSFGAVRIDGVSAPRSVRITNPQQRPLEILDLVQQPGSGHGTDFVLEGLTGSPTMAPGASLEVSFTFRPRGPGTGSRRGGYVIETREGPLAMITMVGRASRTMDEAVAGGSTSARDEAAAKDQRRRKHQWTRTARQQGPIAWGPVTYADLEAAFAAACEHGEAGHYEEAIELAEVVQTRLRELTHPDKVHRVLETYDIAPTAPLMELATATGGVHSLLMHAISLSTIKGDSYLHQLQVGARMLRLITGESSDAGAYQAFDRATWGTAAVAAAPLAVGLAVAAPQVAVPLATRAVTAVAVESSLMWAASRGAFAWAFNYYAQHPEEATAWAELFIGLGFSAGEDPEKFIADLQTVDGWNRILRDILFAIAPVRGGGGGDDNAAPRRAPDGSEPERALPPAVRRNVDGPAPTTTDRARRVGLDGLDRLRALADAVRTRKQAVTVPRARSSAARDGDDHPQTAADDAEPVADRGVSFRERNDRALHGRRVSRAEAREELYEAQRAESAILVADLRKQGGRVVTRVDDELTGDTFVTVELPNRRRVSIREQGNAPPREKPSVDPRRAAELTHEATQAKDHNRRRDEQLAALLARSIQLDDAGAEHVTAIADKVIVGGGPAAVMDYATLPGRTGKVVGDDGAELVDARTYAISDQPEGSWDGRDISTGQPPGEYSKLPFSVQPAELAQHPTRFADAQALADSATLTRDRTGMPVLRGWKVVAMDSVPDATWRERAAARRLKLDDGNGRTRYIYARTVDLVGGLGPARMPSDAQYGAGGAAHRAELEGAGVVVSAEAHLSSARRVAKVLISGGGATAPWNSSLVAKLTPDATIHWIAQAGGGGSPRARQSQAHVTQRIQKIGHELTEIDLGLTLSFDPPEKARLLEKQQALRDELTYLEQRRRDLTFGDAMLDRNIDPEGPLSNPNITRFVKSIDTIDSVRADGTLRARVRFTDGTEDTYDQVIVNHGADNSVPGSPGALLKNERLRVAKTSTRAHLVSADRAVRVAGASSYVTRNVPRANTPEADGDPPRLEHESGIERQPRYSREVPSFHWAGEQIREMNEP